MKFSLLALSASLLSQVSGAVIPSADVTTLAIGEDTSPNLPEPNVLEKRASLTCYPASERKATSAALERIAVYFDSLGDTRWLFRGAMRMRREDNRDVPGGWSEVWAHGNKNGQPSSHQVASSGRHIAMGIRDIIKGCTNNNCPGKGYCGTGGEGVAWGNGEFVIKTDGGGNW